MRGIAGPMDNTEMTRALRATEMAVDNHTRQTHFFRAPETVALREVAEVAATATMGSAIKQGGGAIYQAVIKNQLVRTTGKYTIIGVSVAGIATTGLWVFTRLGSVSLSVLGQSADDLEEFAASRPLAAAGIGLGMLLGVTALGIVVYRRFTGGGDDE